jgi:hypothetical protein
VIAQAPFTVSSNTNYRVRLEAINTSLRLYVNGKLVVEGKNSAYGKGRYGLITSDASADFDNFSAVRP